MYTVYVMDPLVPNKKLDPGVFQGTPVSEGPKEAEVAPYFIRTMKGDISDLMRKKDEALLSQAVADRQKSERSHREALTATEDIDSPTPKPRGRLIIALSLIALILVTILVYIFVIPRLASIRLPSISFGTKNASSTAETPVTPVATPLAPSLLPAQSEIRFNLSVDVPLQVAQTLLNEHSSGLQSGLIKNLYFTEDVPGAPLQISPARLFEFMNVRAPDLLLRSLEKDFMAGFIGEADGGATPFIILKVSDRNLALAGMLDWETTLPDLFSIMTGTKITTDSSVRFHDSVVGGKDARVLDTLDSAGVIAYAFLDQNTIVIAGSVPSLETLLTLAGTK